MVVQWYPGHMAKAKREIEEKIKLVDIVYELIDARIPYSSKNPMITDILKNKPHLVLLTKTSMAHPQMTKKWEAYYKELGVEVLAIDSLSGDNVKKIEVLSKEILNVAITGNKPGVTKAQQWIRINQNLELLDTPGVLWPKFEDQKVGVHLALTGAIKSEILHNDDLVLYLISFLRENYPKVLENRYGIDEELDNIGILESIMKKRGIHKDDYDKCYELIMNEFRSLKLGRITLDII